MLRFVQAAAPPPDLAVHLVEGLLHLLAALAVERAFLGVEVRERAHDHVHRLLHAHRVQPEVGVHRLLVRHEDGVEERAHLEDRGFSRPRAPGESLHPVVEPEPDGEDEAGLRERGHVLGSRVEAVVVVAGGEDEAHGQAVSGHAPHHVVEGEDGDGHAEEGLLVPPAGCGGEDRQEHDEAGEPGHVMGPSRGSRTGAGDDIVSTKKFREGQNVAGRGG